MARQNMTSSNQKRESRRQNLPVRSTRQRKTKEEATVSFNSPKSSPPKSRSKTRRLVAKPDAKPPVRGRAAKATKSDRRSQRSKSSSVADDRSADEVPTTRRPSSRQTKSEAAKLLVASSPPAKAKQPLRTDNVKPVDRVVSTERPKPDDKGKGKTKAKRKDSATSASLRKSRTKTSGASSVDTPEATADSPARRLPSRKTKSAAVSELSSNSSSPVRVAVRDTSLKECKQSEVDMKAKSEECFSTRRDVISAFGQGATPRQNQKSEDDIPSRANKMSSKRSGAPTPKKTEVGKSKASSLPEDDLNDSTRKRRVKRRQTDVAAVAQTKEESKGKKSSNGGQVATHPLVKRRKLDPSSDGKKTSGNNGRKKSRAASSGTGGKGKEEEDPYDFEAYLSTFDPMKKSSRKRVEKDKASQPPLSHKPVLNAASVVRRSKNHAHLFFIQPCKTRKKGATAAPSDREEPSPSIADEIAEIALQPPCPFEPEPVPRFSVLPSSSAHRAVAISTPRANLLALEAEKPDALKLSPIQAQSPSGTSGIAPGGAVLVESSLANSPHRKAKVSPEKSAESAGEKQQSRSLSGDEADPGQSSRSGGKHPRKSAAKEAKDEFEAWLVKFNQELSDIESFQLSIERSQ